ncbi:hypothetical protein RAY_28 [Erwinia phage vB_EamM_RAY]|uniref:Uncharacterized protein n=1 Tax=Erwinia phage vB_EamM_RAY TaxID=1815987 RepID=A0A173GEH8_9CAUD|nr:hypothetical protein FDH98_gp028 [Erwinia phage vB_EamM_RAY]ANH51809.1 hypothetical protein RAY_28 [Erwinia phage vB_EamM_RAY]
MTLYKEHVVLCIVQSDAATEAWAELSQLVFDNPTLMFDQEDFTRLLNLALADDRDEMIKYIRTALTVDLNIELINWLTDSMLDIAYALRKSLPVLTPTQPGVVAKCEYLSHCRRNVVLKATILEPLPKEHLTVIHF